MTPQERQRVAELFERLTTLENTRRDPEAVEAINEGFERAPHAAYALVQSVLIQDEALKKAEARIRELEGGAPQEKDESFLGNIRDSIFGQRDNGRGSVPSIRPGAPVEMPNLPGDRGMQGQQPMQGQQSMGQGGSFLGTAAAAAVGVIGGTMLMNSLQGMLGGGHHKHAAFDAPAEKSNPWSSDNSGGDLARQAGIDDIGHGGRHASMDDGDKRQGLFDVAQNDDDNDDFGDDGDFDIGGDMDTA